MNKKGFTLAELLIIIVILVIVVIVILPVITTVSNKNRSFTILSNPDNKDFMDNLVDYGKSNGIKVKIEYADDLEIIDLIEESNNYDAVWMANSMWIYMTQNAKITNSKSIYINPVVMGIKKSKAKSLGFVNNDIYNNDIVSAINDGKLKYVMNSVTKTNSGLTAYLGFLNALAGSPEILRSNDLKNRKLVGNLKTLFSGVERVSGDTNFLENMFLKSNDYEAVIASETSLIHINNELEKNKKETLYLIYPIDGVAINDSPFAYVDRGQDKLDKFNILQSYLLSLDVQKDLEKLGKRTWYGGIKKSSNDSIFKKEWGIDVTKYLIPLKYPSKSVINEAINLYIDEIRKPSSVVFCLDYSGSMYGDGKKQLSDAMSYILNREEAGKDNLQFSFKDKITVIPFDSSNGDIWTSNGENTSSLIQSIDAKSPYGGTNIYGCTIEALDLLSNESNDYIKTIILMTDGESNIGSFSSLRSYYNSLNKYIPIYSIMFGSADSSQLNDIADLTNSKVFDGRTNLKSAFKEVRSYN